MPKFNDPAGSVHQQTCESSCGIVGGANGRNTRADDRGILIDIEYVLDSAGDPIITRGLRKCFTCQRIADHFA